MLFVEMRTSVCAVVTFVAVISCGHAAIQLCKLDSSPTAVYKCLTEDGSTDCLGQVPSTTAVQASCKPGFYSTIELPRMHCVDGAWTYIARCFDDCGTLTPAGQELRRRRSTRSVPRGAVPWHASVYRKTTSPPTMVCGATLIAKKVAISVAHCFWNSIENKQMPATDFAMAVGKVSRGWEAVEDQHVQKADVTFIKIPQRFHGQESNYQDDISLVVVAKEFVFNIYVRPVCVDFDEAFEREQLQANNLGRIAGWGLSPSEGRPSKSLKVLDIPYTPIDQCLTTAPESFRPFITRDKFCAGYTNGTTLCKGDSGGGLAFPSQVRGTTRYYLRGVASVAPIAPGGNQCGINLFFTKISKHEHFIKDV